MRRQQQHQQHQDQQSRVFDDLSSLVLNLLRSRPPSPLQFSDQAPPLAPQPTAVSSSRRRPSSPQISPAGFASLMLGISVALMLCGWLTFFIGFILMPWIIGLFMVFYVAGIVSSLSMLGRSIFCHATAPTSPRKEISVGYIFMDELSRAISPFYPSASGAINSGFSQPPGPGPSDPSLGVPIYDPNSNQDQHGPSEEGVGLTEIQN